MCLHGFHWLCLGLHRALLKLGIYSSGNLKTTAFRWMWFPYLSCQKELPCSTTNVSAAKIFAKVMHKLSDDMYVGLFLVLPFIMVRMTVRFYITWTVFWELWFSCTGYCFIRLGSPLPSYSSSLFIYASQLILEVDLQSSGKERTSLDVWNVCIYDNLKNVWE